MALRQRFACTSSKGSEIGLFNQEVIHIEAQPVFMCPSILPAAITVAAPTSTTVGKEYYYSKPLQQPPPSKPGLFTVGSPERECKTEKDEGFGVFLQTCSLCMKKLQPDKDIFMYGYLGAFCSPHCRYYRFLLERVDTKEVVKVPTTMAPSKRFRGCFCL